MQKTDYESLAAFRYAIRKYLHFSEQAAHALAVTPQQYQALLAIQGFPGRSRITVGELAEQMQIAAHSAVGLADRLQTAGFIGRHASETDRRCVFLELTPLGRKTLQKLAAAHRKELQTVGPLLVGLIERVKQL